MKVEIAIPDEMLRRFGAEFPAKETLGRVAKALRKAGVRVTTRQLEAAWDGHAPFTQYQVLAESALRILGNSLRGSITVCRPPRHSAKGGRTIAHRRNG